MFLSSLLINVGDNPDRPRPGRLWLRNLYLVHQRLCMAFPSASRKGADPAFLQPYKPEEFGHNQVHMERQQDAGFLFRIDPLFGNRAMILVQSAMKPDWDYAFHNASFLAAYDVKPYQPSFARGQCLRFRLVANPTKKINTIRKGERQQATKEELKEMNGRHGKRIPVPCATEIEDWRFKNPGKDTRLFIDSQLFNWLARQGEERGFCLPKKSTQIQVGYIYCKKPRDHQGQRLRSIRYDGVLQVTDPARIHAAVIHGIGPGKAFGFGLLSLASCKNSLSMEAM